MSYIHEALKKAQRERDLLSRKKNVPRSVRRYEPRILRREWVVSSCFLIIGAAFLSYSWFYSPHQPASDREEALAVPQPVQESPEPPAPTKPQEAVANPGPVTFQVSAKTETMANGGTAASSDNELKKKAQEASQQTPATNSAPEKAEELYRQGLALHKAGRVQEGKKLYEAALQQSPDLVAALNNLGTIYVKEKEYLSAGRMFQKAIRADPQYVDPYYNLACLYALQEDLSRSLFYLKKAISVDQAARNWAMTDKDLENLRGHAEYERIIEGA